MLFSGGVPTMPRSGWSPRSIMASMRFRLAAAAAEDSSRRLISSLRMCGADG